MAVFFALLIIFIYIAIRFKKWQYGMGGMISLAHDTLIVISLYSIFSGILPFNLEVDQTFIAALLTIIGYSINDTVVIFDRIREYVGLYPKRPIEENMNNAMVDMKKDLKGEVMFIFQPAEEGPPDGETGGASAMLGEGLFKNYKPQAIFGLHVWSALNAGQVGFRSGPAMAASDRFRIVVKGRQTHGSRPWGGVDPIVAAANIVTTTQTIVSRRMDISKLPVVVSFGAIKGGIRYNIIPDEVELIGTIRTFDEGMRQKVFTELKNIAANVAEAHGATVVSEVPDTIGNPATVNNPELTASSVPSLVKAAGAENVVNMSLVMGAEDFSYYANEVPGFFFFVGATPVGQDAANAPSNHSPEFFLDESALKVGTRSLLQVALDYMNQAP